MDEADPDRRGLIGESYRIEAVTAAECRSIFLDWALGFPADADIGAALRILLARHGGAEGHPMTALLREAVKAPPRVPARRGDRRGGRRAGR